MEFLLCDTPFGQIGIGQEEEVLVRLYLPNTPVPRLISRETPLLKEAEEQLLAYCAGERKEFSLPFQFKGTEFQKEVWHFLMKIPYGTVCTYGEVAEAVGKPKAFQAVGAAIGKNPLPIFVPCHRVLGADGSLTGYAGGLELKAQLLTLEGIAWRERERP